MAKKFFELIPSGTSFKFVENRTRWLLLSLILVLASVGVLAFNQVSKGSALNFGIDFQGGSQVRLALQDGGPELAEVRDALGEFGYEGSSAVSVPDANNEVLIRVKETVVVEEAVLKSCEGALAASTKGKLVEGSFYHPPASSKIFVRFDAEPDREEIERLFNEAGCEGVSDLGLPKDGEYPLDHTLVGVGSKIVEQLDGKFGPGTVDHVVASETVGPKVGGQLKIDGALSMLYAIGFIFLFVMIRFDLRFAPGGIVALTHDTIIVVGAFALTGKEFNLQTVAALLTIIGYSINDTIVVFDRIRERVAMDREADIEETTNLAMNETLSRTVLTSGTTMIVVLATWILGSGPIKDFAFALFMGVIVGTYSSLFVAAPVFLWVNKRFYKGQGHLLSAASEDREGTGTLLGGPAAADEPQSGGASDGAGEISAPPTSSGDDAGAGGEKKTRRRRRKRPQG